MDQDTSNEVGIIGAGISGLLAARCLSDHKIPFWIIDKGRGVGGRMATRRIGEGVVDHGAQYFTARESAFRATVDQALADGVVRHWATGFRLGDGTLKSSGEPRVIGCSGINAFPREVARGIDVSLSVQATAIRHDGASWVVDIKDAAPLRAATLLVTCPAPQSVELLAAGSVELPAAIRDALSAVQYDPGFALLVVCEGPTGIPEPGGLWPSEGPFAWIADNQQKGISPVGSLTFHTRPEFTRAHLDDDREVLTRDLLKAAQPFIKSPVRDVQLHRWLYSIPTFTHPDRILVAEEPGTIVFAGDGFGGPRVEGAALSGIAAGDYLMGAGKNSS